MRWRSLEGHKAFLNALSHPESKYEALPEMLDTSWWLKNIKSNASILKIRCKTCGFEPETTCLMHYVKALPAGRAGCFCNNRAGHNSAFAQKKFIELLSSSRLEAVDPVEDYTWWKANVLNNTAQISLKCSDCGYVAVSSIKKVAAANGSMKCLCNGHVLASDNGYRELVLKKLFQTESNVTPSHKMLSLAWWKENIQSSEDALILMCDRCGAESSSTTVHNIMSKDRVTTACNCRFKTQTLVLEWTKQFTKDMFPELTVTNEKIFDTLRDKRPLRYDVCVLDSSGHVVLLIEIDGDQHFKPWGGNKKFEDLQRHDLMKDKWASTHNIPLIRLVQRSVWNEKFDWKSLIKSTIHDLTQGNVPTCVIYQPGAKEYTTGTFAELRS